jgi:hypothetical protein
MKKKIVGHIKIKFHFLGSPSYVETKEGNRLKVPKYRLLN